MYNCVNYFLHQNGPTFRSYHSFVQKEVDDGHSPFDMDVFAIEVDQCCDAAISVTRCGEKSPLWPNFKSLRQFLKPSFCIGEIIELTLAIFCFWANFHWCKWPNIEKYFCHLVTLAALESPFEDAFFFMEPSRDRHQTETNICFT